MGSKLVENLRKKGWSEEEIEQTVSLFDKDVQGNPIFSPKLSKVVYWSGIAIGIIGNLMISATMVPFLVFLDPMMVYFILFVLGFVFGSLFNVLLNDLEYLDVRHHVIASVFIPIMAVINVYIMVDLVNHLYAVLFSSSKDIISTLHLHNATLMALCYVGAFLLPSIYSFFKRKIQIKK